MKDELPNEVSLVAPNGSPIVGVEGADKSVRAFRFTYNYRTKVSMYVLHDGSSLPSQPAKLVAADGGTWVSQLVEWHTLFKA